MRSIALGEYRNLMHAFCSGLISGRDFQDGYAKLANEDKATRPEEISRILGSVSAELSASRDRERAGGGLDEASLRTLVGDALRVLDAIKHGSV